MKIQMKLFFYCLSVASIYYFLLLLSYHILYFELPLNLLTNEVSLEAVRLGRYLILLFLVAIAYFLVKKQVLFIKNSTEEKVLKYIIPICLAFLTQIINNPIFRYHEIVGNKIIENKAYVLEEEPLSLVLIFFSIVILTPIIEEVVFRGYILGAFVKRKKYYIIGIIASTLLFSLTHSFPFSAIAAFNIGIISSILFLRFGLLSAIIFHSFYNLIWFFFKINESLYWDLIKYGNFNIFYWLFVALCAIIIIYFLISSYSSIAPARA